MNRIIANYIKDNLIDLPFADKVGGLVQTLEYKDPTGENKMIAKKMPVSYDIINQDGTVSDDCIGRNQELVPNSSKRSIMYVEDNGATPIGADRRGLKLSSSLIIVGWLNRKRLVNNEFTEISHYCIMQILEMFVGKNPTNLQGITSLTFSGGQILPQDNKIFSKYSYDEKIMQYLRPPYDAFAIALKAEYVVNKHCAQEIIFGDYEPC